MEQNTEISSSVGTMENNLELPVQNKATDDCDTVNNKEINDPYAYLERDGFSSEKFKIEIRGLPKYYGMKELKKLFNNKLKLNVTKIKIPSERSPWIYVCFKSEEEKLNAIKTLHNYKWRNTILRAEEAKPVPDPLVQKRLLNSIDSEIDNKKPKLDDNLILENMRDATTPLWKLPYEEQLSKKTKLITGLLKSYAIKLLKANSRATRWYNEQKSKYNGLPCEVLPIRNAESIHGYRNKCEFTIGMNESTKKKTVGFRTCSYVKGSVNVAPVDGALNVPDRMKEAVAAFQNFIQNSELDVFNPELHEGYWRQLTARYGFKTNELMLIVGFNPQQMTKEELTELKNKLKDYFLEGEGKSCNITSFYLHQIKRRTCQDDNTIYEHVFGQTHITEKLLGRTFRISPQAFFQVNTNGAEILYESIGELAELAPEVTLLDVCCGTGSIGICLSDKCGEVLGLEISKEAIADAQENSTVNNVTNAQFFTGKAEEILSCVAQKASKKEIVAIVDPPRAGLQHDALVQLRKCKNIKRLVYVSCDPRKAVKNFVDLGRSESKIYKEDPFFPVKAIPIDLFPFTPHCELLTYFERKSEY